MKKSFLFFFLWFISFSTFAQIHQPVKWFISCSEIGNNGDAVLSFQATTDEGWHIYDQNLPEDGPRSTSFVFQKLKGTACGTLRKEGATMISVPLGNG